MSPTAPAATRRCYEMCRRRCRTLASARVLDYLYWCHRRHGRATPSRAQIAGATGYCERTVTRAVGELEALGALRVYRDPPHRLKNGTYTRARTNLYRLKWPPRACSHRGDMDGTSKPLREAVEPAGASRRRSTAPSSAVPRTVAGHKTGCSCYSCYYGPGGAT